MDNRQPSRSRPRDRRVSSSEAAKNFGRLVARVREEGASYVVERSGAPVVRVSPAGEPTFTLRDFKAFLQQHLPATEDYGRAVGRAVASHNTRRVRRNPWAR